MNENQIKLELKKNLLLDFHKQFAVNQRDKEYSFLKILGFLGAVILGYSYVYHKTDIFNIIELSFIALLSEALLVFGSLVVLSIAYNFRRDQTVISKIREYAKVSGNDRIFPDSYDTRISDSLKHWHLWLPNFLSPYFLVFPTIILILVISYIVKLDLMFTLTDIDWLVTVTILGGFSSLIIIALVYFSFYKKLMKFIERII